MADWTFYGEEQAELRQALVNKGNIFLNEEHINYNKTEPWEKT